MRPLLLAISLAVASASITGVSFSVPSSQHVAAYRIDASKLAIVRRGVAFSLKVTFSSTPSTDIAVTVSPSAKWQISPASIQGNVATIQVIPPVISAVGRYTLTLTVGGVSMRVTPDVAVLFNPYSSDDVVSIDATTAQEYVENENGVLWLGSMTQHSSIAWFFAQYNEASLLSALHILSTMTTGTSDPIQVARTFSRYATLQTGVKDGVLVGNWGSDFSGGTPPTQWTGSDQVLAKYVSSGFKPVKYAQCWVFGGVMNTLMRTMGIPSLQLTTFDAAHESPNDQGKYIHEIKMYYDKSGKLMTQEGSIWNFHSWNQAWINNQWMQVDGTPQEMSIDGGNRFYEMGPVPLTAVHDMDESAKYDVAFAISEVHSKVHNFLVTCTSGSSCKIVKDLGYDTQADVAGLIVTKTEGQTKTSIRDITSWYHLPRNIIPKMSLGFGESQNLSVSVSGTNTAVGDEMPVIVMLKANPALRTGQPVLVNLTLSAAYRYNHGPNHTAPAEAFFSKAETITLDSSNGFQFTLKAAVRVTPKEFMWPRDSTVILTAFAQAVDSPDTDISSASAGISPPKVIVQLHDEAVVRVNSNFSVDVGFTNPLDVPLSDVVMMVQGTLMAPSEGVRVDVEDIPAHGSKNFSVRLSPQVAGVRCVVAQLWANEMAGIMGHIDVNVQDAI